PCILSMLFVLSSIWSGSPPQDADKRPGAGLNMEPWLEPEQQDQAAQVDGDNPDKRRDWFLFQRTYPFDSLPKDARRKAWRAHRRTQGITAMAVPPQWTPIGPSPTSPGSLVNNWGLCSGRIDTIAVAPNNSQLVLVGGATGGIWRSVDGGATFVPVSDNQVDLAVGSIKFAPSN